MPSVLAFKPVGKEVSQPPDLTTVSSRAIFLTIPKINAQVCCIVESKEDGLRPFAPATMIPWSEHAFRSMAAFFRPVVRRSLKFGSAEMTSAGKPVRSLMVLIIENGLSRSMSADL